MYSLWMKWIEEEKKVMNITRIFQNENTNVIKIAQKSEYNKSFHFRFHVYLFMHKSEECGTRQKSK